jgi:hypothetical protein
VFYLTYLIYVTILSKGSRRVKNQAEFDLKRLIQVYFIILLLDWAGITVLCICKQTNLVMDTGKIDGSRATRFRNHHISNLSLIFAYQILTSFVGNVSQLKNRISRVFNGPYFSN